MVNEKHLFWYHMIKYLKSKRQITNGLTIPYIIGAKKMLDESYVIDENSIEALLNEIVESSIDEAATYQLCMDIREYVIGLENPNEPSLRHENFISDSTGVKKLYLIGEAADYGSTVQEISQKLNEFYLPYLLEGKYSWSRKEYGWYEFSDDEIKYLTGLKMA